MTDLKWTELADATIRLIREAGWPILAGGAMVYLAAKLIDAWGKKPK